MAELPPRLLGVGAKVDPGVEPTGDCAQHDGNDEPCRRHDAHGTAGGQQQQAGTGCGTEHGPHQPILHVAIDRPLAHGQVALARA